MVSRIAVSVSVLLALALCGCSVVVDPESLLIRCAVESGQADPCAKLDMICAGGTCQSCEAALELCDGRDNDCDGQVDEGADSDRDGFTWCGGGHAELVDCVPDDPNIHPTLREGDNGTQAMEVCDGLDNDCDGETDEDQRCDEMRSCTTSEDCASGLQCDTASGQCLAPRNEGSLCRTDAECGEGFCVSARAIGLGDVLSDNLCASACCKDADCPEKSVCVQSGSGARVCLPAEIAGRERAEEGEACTISAQCTSGVCQLGRCIATCSRATDCESETCRLNVTVASFLSGAGAWICGEAAGRGETSTQCTSLDFGACQSALCLDGRCAPPCGSDADCGIEGSCAYVRLGALQGGGRVTACVPNARDQSTDAVCCTNADCAAGEVCRPMEVGDGWGMFCESNALD